MDIFGSHCAQTAAATQALAGRLAQNLVKPQTISQRSAVIICLYGELGSGKTTFSQGFAAGLGMKNRLLSPTFIVMRTYDLPGGWEFHHLDLYRVNDSQELRDLGINEVLARQHNIVLIEWAERLGDFLPASRIDVNFKFTEGDGRKIDISYGNL